MGNDELLRFPGVWPRFHEGDDLSGDKADAFFVANVDGVFRDMGRALGFQPGTVSRGIALADIDGDGDQDALIARQWMPSILLQNTADHPANGVVLDLRFENPNGTTRPAIGKPPMSDFCAVECDAVMRKTESAPLAALTPM